MQEPATTLQGLAVELQDLLNAGASLEDLVSLSPWRELIAYPSSGFNFAARVQLQNSEGSTWLHRDEDQWIVEEAKSPPTTEPTESLVASGALSSAAGSVGPAREVERVRDQASGLQTMGGLVEVIGWISMAVAVIAGVVVAVTPDEQVRSISGEEVYRPIEGVLVFAYLGFGALLLVIAGRAVALFAAHVHLHAGE